MFRTLLAVIAFITLAFPVMAQDGHKGHDHSSHDHSHDSEEAKLIITPIVPNKLQANVTNEVILFIQDIQAKPVDVSKFEVVHTQPIHLLIIEPGLNDYHHEHPVQKAVGQYAFNLTPQTACSYRIWADVQLQGSNQHYIPIDLQGEEDCKGHMQKAINFESSSQGYDFKLKLEGDLKVGEEVFASLSISKDGKPVEFLEPVMGAFAHLVGFYEDYETIAHIHPIGKEPTDVSERGGPVLRFHIEPSHTGYLKLFAQVQIDGEQIYTPFGLKVN